MIIDHNFTMECPSVAQLTKFQSPVTDKATCLETLNLFLESIELLGIPVVNDSNQPIHLVQRQMFVEYFSRPFVRELHGRKLIVDFLANVADYPASQAITVEESTMIDDVAQMIIDAGMQHMVTGFTVTKENAYLGIVDGHSLLDEITRRKQSDLYYLAHYDQLTGLPNRMLFDDRLNRAILDAARNDGMVGLMFVDIDRFKQVNDTLGHGLGDLLLRHVASRIRHCTRESDTVGRLGGDEFAILMCNISCPEDVKIIAERILTTMKEPLVITDQLLSITVSIGIAIYPIDDTKVTGLLAKADSAMYETKRNGRNNFRYYKSGLSITNSEHGILDTELRQGIQKNEFLLYYQPKINLENGKATAVEALVRWKHSSRGLVSPVHFIPLAEESGVIIDLGTWVFRQACTQHCLWRDAGFPGISMAINISPLQFRQKGFIDLVHQIITETGVEPRFIELEMTEGTLMLNASSVLETLQQLKTIGVRLAIDDFGTGYSNLSYLKNFPIDCIKIDQSFVKGINSSFVNKSIVHAIVSMANCLSMETVIEGVETSEELATAIKCKCKTAQGYHFARPLPPDEFLDWLKEHNVADEL